MRTSQPTKRLNPFRRHLGVCLIGGALAGGLVSMPSAVSAQETDAIAAERVPAPILATARANYLDSRDVAFRKFDESGRYQVNFTTPTNLRMQVIIDRDGKLVDGPQLAPNQLAGAPAGAERDRLAAQWVVRVRQSAQAAPGAPSVPAPEAPPPAPAPVAPVTAAVPAPPTTPGGAAAPAGDPVSTEIRAADLPKPVNESLERFTTGAKDVNYYKQTIEDRTRYQAVYTAKDGSRQEVTVAEHGSLMSGPLVLSAQVDDKSLLADRPDNQTVATSIRVDPTDIPARAMDTIGKYVQKASDVRYRRDTFSDGSVGYTAHWVQSNNGRRYYITASESGELQQAPKLSMYQPAAAPNAQPTGIAITWSDLPDSVKKTLEPLTRSDRQARYYKQTQDGKVFYGSVYRVNGNEMWVRVDEAGKTVVNPVSARTGKRVETAEPVAAKMPGDRVTFKELPDPVQAKVLEETRGSKDVINMRQMKNGVAVYHTVWTDANGTRKELFLDSKGEAVPFKVE